MHWRRHDQVPSVNKRLLTIAFAVSLGRFIFGYDLGALSSASLSLRSAFGLSPASFGLTISISLWGTVCGSLLAGWCADRVSRRNLIAGCAVIYAVGAVAVIRPVRQEWLLVLAIRALCGLAVGGLTVGCPLYLSELAPISARGRFVSLFQVQVGIGVIAAFFVGSALAKGAIAADAWRWSLGIGLVPAALLACLLIALPGAGAEFSARPSREAEGDSAHTGLDACAAREKLFRRKNLRPLLLATSIALFNQLSGVNILLLYMLDILASAGVELSLGHTYTVVISCVGLLTTLIAMTIVDSFGRKPLLLAGAAGMGICLFSLAVAVPRHFVPHLYLAILVAYNVFFGLSQGTVVWVYLSELFPPGLRGSGQGYGSSVHWITNAILVLIFPAMQHASSIEIFYVLALLMVIQIGVVWLWYPETRGTQLGAATYK